MTKGKSLIAEGDSKLDKGAWVTVMSNMRELSLKTLDCNARVLSILLLLDNLSQSTREGHSNNVFINLIKHSYLRRVSELSTAEEEPGTADLLTFC